MKNNQVGHFVDVEDLSVYYIDRGKGDSLILLHGGGLTSRMWHPHQSILKDSFHVYSLDCRGHGRTNNPLGVLSYDLLVEDLAGFIRELEISQPYVCGWSMGARVALEYASRYPKEIKGLVCCGGGPPISEGELRESLNEQSRALLEPKVAEDMRSRHSHIYGDSYWRTLGQQLLDLLKEGTSAVNTSRISCPTLVICGESEVRPDPKAYLSLSQHIAGGDILMINSADHLWPIEQAQSLCDIITRFFIQSTNGQKQKNGLPDSKR